MKFFQDAFGDKSQNIYRGSLESNVLLFLKKEKEIYISDFDGHDLIDLEIIRIGDPIENSSLINLIKNDRGQITTLQYQFEDEYQSRRVYRVKINSREDFLLDIYGTPYLSSGNNLESPEENSLGNLREDFKRACSNYGISREIDLEKRVYFKE